MFVSQKSAKRFLASFLAPPHTSCIYFRTSSASPFSCALFVPWTQKPRWLILEIWKGTSKQPSPAQTLSTILFSSLFFHLLFSILVFCWRWADFGGHFCKAPKSIQSAPDSQFYRRFSFRVSVACPSEQKNELKRRKLDANWLFIDTIRRNCE